MFSSCVVEWANFTAGATFRKDNNGGRVRRSRLGSCSEDGVTSISVRELYQTFVLLGSHG
jgi:hypothetical protein